MKEIIKLEECIWNISNQTELYPDSSSKQINKENQTGYKDMIKNYPEEISQKLNKQNKYTYFINNGNKVNNVMFTIDQTSNKLENDHSVG